MKILNSLLFILCSFFAYSQGFTIDNYHIDVVLDESGKASITETLDVNFHEKKRGIIREIPTRGKFKGHKQSIKISKVDVENWKFKTTQGSDYKIRIGDKNTFITGKQQYVIRYVATNGILNFENHQEFYWTLIGGEWDVDIINASYTVTLPQDIDLSESDYQVFSGEVGEATRFGTIEKQGKVFSGMSLAVLGKNNALSVGIRLPKTYFTQTAKELEPQKTYSEDRSFPLPILMVIGFIFSFFKWGRNKKENPIGTRYYPPENMSSAEVGTYFDFAVHDRDLLSLIPYWGEKGYIKIRIAKSIDRDDIYIEKIRELSDNHPPHELFFFDHLFTLGDIVFVEDLEDTFYEPFKISRSMLKSEVKEMDLYDADAVRSFHSKGAIILALLSFVVGIASIYFFRWIPTGIGFFVLGLLFLIFKSLRPKRSNRGQELHNQLIQFENTIKKPDPKQLQKITAEDPRYFDKIFPYAVAFGIDKSWLDSFKEIAMVPDWYYYDDNRNFGYEDFSNDFNLKKIKSKMVAPIADSRSSSFSGGGGSSGGGFGGGGDSSW